jgi:putative endonuclease
VTPAELGQRAELAVADYLFALGFDLLGRNVRLGHLELDVVARQGPLLVVAEVRTRGQGSFMSAFESVSRSKRRRLSLAVDRLWRRHPSWTTNVDRVRLDVAAVSFVGRETHIDYAASAF